jgi:hypothetical protein
MRALVKFIFLFFVLVPINCVASDGRPMKNFEITIDCARAISAALKDLQSSFPNMSETTFKQRFDLVSCRKTRTKITIRFYPSSPEIRGGAIRYLVDASTFEVTERHGER